MKEEFSWHFSFAMAYIRRAEEIKSRQDQASRIEQAHDLMYYYERIEPVKTRVNGKEIDPVACVASLMHVLGPEG